jgi:branched-chain amino acid transport system permease protein
MSTLVLLVVTGVALGCLNFVAASGLALVLGLMRVLNLAHGVLVTVGAYACWWAVERMAGGGATTWPQFLAGVVIATSGAAAVALVLERGLLRPLYERPLSQLLATIGVQLLGIALVTALWGGSARPFPLPAALGGTTRLMGATIPTSRLALISAAAVVFAALRLFLNRSSAGLVIRAGVENRSMVTALGIDVRRAFTLVFAISGALAGITGVASGVFFGTLDPNRGTALLISAIIVIVVGGEGDRALEGAAVAAVVLGLVQQLANYYGPTGAGDIAVLVLLAVVLLSRPTALDQVTA